MQNFLKQLTPFVLLGMALVAFAFGIFILAYLFLIGTIIGVILFSISWIKMRFFSKKEYPVKSPKKGRIIHSDDWHKMD